MKYNVVFLLISFSSFSIFARPFALETTCNQLKQQEDTNNLTGSLRMFSQLVKSLGITKKTCDFIVPAAATIILSQNQTLTGSLAENLKVIKLEEQSDSLYLTRLSQKETFFPQSVFQIVTF